MNEKELAKIKELHIQKEKEVKEAYEKYSSLKKELEELDNILFHRNKLIELGLENQMNINMPIELLELSVRSYNALKRTFINTVEDLYVQNENIFKIRNLGKKSAREILESLKTLNFDVSVFKFEEFYNEKL